MNPQLLNFVEFWFYALLCSSLFIVLASSIINNILRCKAQKKFINTLKKDNTFINLANSLKNKTIDRNLTKSEVTKLTNYLLKKSLKLSVKEKSHIVYGILQRSPQGRLNMLEKYMNSVE